MDLLSLLRGEGVEVKRHGRVYRALCPFHVERFPSFTIWPDSGRYHCFGCGVSGDTIQFLRDYKGLRFRDAANQVGYELQNPKKRIKGAKIRKLRAQFFSWLRDFEEILCQAYRELHYLENLPTRSDFLSLPQYYADWYWATQQIEYSLDIIQFGSLAEKFELFREKRFGKVQSGCSFG